MTTVFLSHSSKDKDLARRLANDLSGQGINVWFDEWEIRIGQSITQKIEQGLEEADFVAVLLTKHSVKSGWVEREWHSKIGEEAISGKVVVLPLRAEICAIPSLLKNKRYANFEKDYQTGLNNLVRDIKAYTTETISQQAGESVSLRQQVGNLPVGGLPTPCFFPSVSGAAKNALSPIEHLDVLIALRHPLFLVSAYDIANTRNSDGTDMKHPIKKATADGQIVILDSGLYEKKWLRARRWPKPTFHKMLRETACHLAFCYDNPKPERDIDKNVADIVSTVGSDKKSGAMNAIIPIVHARCPTDFPIICTKLIKEIEPPLIAFPERELGEGVLEVAQTIRSIRKALDAKGQGYPIHILGAGNPLSILIYAACGAESFDGLDWCQTVADHSTGRLYHSLQMDFFADQTDYASESRLPYLTRVLAHNLVFYEAWMKKIRDGISEGHIFDLVREYVPSLCTMKLKELLSD